MRLLVTGATSLVGFSILESLEGRRADLELLGIASDLDNSEYLRYDRFRVVPRSDEPGFCEHLQACLDEWQPDLVLPGRDPDVAHLAALRDRRPELRQHIATGPGSIAELTLDKGLTSVFAEAHDLAWAPTVVCGPGADSSALAGHSLPWIVKPAHGSGSHGVFLLTHPDHVQQWIHRGGYVMQPLLGPKRQFPTHSTELGTPWFTDVGDPWLRSVQVVIAPEGDIVASYCSDHTLRGGITQSSAQADDPVAVHIGQRWGEALSGAGWRGSVNVQMKVDPALGPTPFEINARMTGATHGRLRLGFDEIGLTLAAWTGLSLAPGPSPRPIVHYRPRAYPG